MKESKFKDIENLIAYVRKADNEFRVYDDALSFILSKREETLRQKKPRGKSFDKILKGLVRADLFPYQKEGIAFASGTGKAIIADEMGLGKTIHANAVAKLAKGIEKALVFSQWERMTRLVAAELDSRKIGFANLNGQIPSAKRKDLLDRFREDDACKIFLSTDAGGVGLILQRASLIINLDIPWNPAVLEQRIGRITGWDKPRIYP